MTQSRLFVLAVVLAAWFSPVLAQPSAAGEWKVNFVVPTGTRFVNMFINQEKTRLTGTVVSEDGEFPLSGRIEGDQVTVVWSVPEDGKLMEITMKGKLTGHVINGTAKLGDVGEGSLTARRDAEGDAMAGSTVAQPAPAPAPAASVAGDWDVTVQSPQGTNTVLVTLKQDGEKLEGLFTSPLGELPFSGTLVGNEMKFNFNFPVDGQPLAITMTGKVDGDSITGKADFGGFAEGDWSATRAKIITGVAAAASPATTPSTTTAESATSTSTTASATAVGGYGGKWDVMVKTPGGDFPAIATLIDEGGKLSGTFGSQMGEVPVSGTIEGKSMKLTMTPQTPNGAMTVVLTGDLDGDSIVNGKADIEGMGQMEWTAKRIKP